MTRLKTVKRNLEFHVADTTALLTSTNPLYSAMEVGIAGMTDQVSIDARITVAALSYAGLGFAFAKGRDVSRGLFKLGQQTSEKIITLHDALYSSLFGLAICPLIYLARGADTEQALIGGLSAGAMNVILGPIMGYSIDATRDLTGLQECKRKAYPEVVRKQSGAVKKGLAATLIAASIAMMAGIYALTPEQQTEILRNPAPQVIETQGK